LEPLRETKRSQGHQQGWRRTLTAFILGATATLLDVGADIYEERIRLQDLLRREVIDVTNAIESAESTNTQLAQLIRHDPSTSSDHLQKLGAALISKHPIIASVHIAPNGIVQQHYPSHATELNGRNLLTHPASRDLSLSTLRNNQTNVGLQKNIGDDAQSLIIRTPINDRNNARERGFIDTHISLKALNRLLSHDSRITTTKLKLEISENAKHRKQ
jgi:sensor domain CHASE-containing protein